MERSRLPRCPPSPLQLRNLEVSSLLVLVCTFQGALGLTAGFLHTCHHFPICPCSPSGQATSTCPQAAVGLFALGEQNLGVVYSAHFSKGFFSFIFTWLNLIPPVMSKKSGFAALIASVDTFSSNVVTPMRPRGTSQLPRPDHVLRGQELCPELSRLAPALISKTIKNKNCTPTWAK